MSSKKGRVCGLRISSFSTSLSLLESGLRRGNKALINPRGGLLVIVDDGCDDSSIELQSIFVDWIVLSCRLSIVAFCVV